MNKKENKRKNTRISIPKLEKTTNVICNYIIVNISSVVIHPEKDTSEYIINAKEFIYSSFFVYLLI